MVDIRELTKLAKKRNITLKLHEKRKQLTGTGVIWDLDVDGGHVTSVTRMKITEYKNPLRRDANVYYNKSSKVWVEFKTEQELVNFIQQYD